MAASGHTPEQQQLLVEMEAVATNIGKQSDVRKASYEVEQGRKLVEKAASVGLPEGDYAKLRGYIADYDGKAAG